MGCGGDDPLIGEVLAGVVPLAVLALGARGLSLLGPALPPDYAAAVDGGTLAVPVLLGLVAFSVALWRARRS